MDRTPSPVTIQRIPPRSEVSMVISGEELNPGLEHNESQ